MKRTSTKLAGIVSNLSAASTTLQSIQTELQQSILLLAEDLPGWLWEPLFVCMEVCTCCDWQGCSIAIATDEPITPAMTAVAKKVRMTSMM